MRNVLLPSYLIICRASILTFQSLLDFDSVSLTLLNSSVSARPEKMETRLTSSNAVMNVSASTAPAWPPAKRAIHI